MNYLITSATHEYLATLDPDELYMVLTDKIQEAPLCVHNTDLGRYVNVNPDDDLRRKVEEVSGEAPFSRAVDIMVLAVSLAFVVGIIGATLWT